MHYVHTLKINRSQNSYKFFNLTIAPNLFGSFNLLVEKGRIGRPSVAITYASGDEGPLLIDLLAHTRKRLSNGYTISHFEVPDETRCAIETYASCRRQVFGKLKGNNKSLFYDYSALRQLVGKAECSTAIGLLIERLSEAADPQSNAKRLNEDLPLFGDFLESEPLSDPKSTDPRRDLLRLLAEHLLEHDPRTLDGVRRALSVPTHPHADNLVFLAARKQDKYVFNVSLFEAFSSTPELNHWVHELADSGIRTLGQLIEIELRELQENFPLEKRLLKVVDATCAGYGLQLGMNNGSVQKRPTITEEGRAQA